jgi:hypothetical protein
MVLTFSEILKVLRLVQFSKQLSGIVFTLSGSTTSSSDGVSLKAPLPILLAVVMVIFLYGQTSFLKTFQ